MSGGDPLTTLLSVDWIKEFDLFRNLIFGFFKAVIVNCDALHS
jgi:hypothetical protein